MSETVFSILPTCIIHNIMSLLERKDVVRMQTWSKTWRGIYELYPCLEFIESQHMRSSIHPSPKDRFRELVNVTLRRFQEQRLFITSFDLVMHLEVLYDSARLDPWIELLIAECNVKEIILSIGFRELYRIPGILFTSSSLTKLKAKMVSIKYSDSMILGGQCSLLILDLKYAMLDEEAINNLKYYCPFLESISIVCCYGYTTFIVDGLNRLKSLKYFHNVDGQDNVAIMILEALRLEVLDLSYIGRKCQVSITSDFGLTELKRLVLKDFYCEGEVVQNIISKSSCSLEYLSISHCVTPEEMMISSPSLKTVIINNLGNLRKIEFDTPELCSFTFRGIKKHPLLFLPDIAPSRCHWSAELYVSHQTINNEWFRELVTFVGTNQFQDLTLDMCYSSIKDICLAESWVSSAKVPIKLQKLQIEFKHLSEPSDDISVLLDALIIRFRTQHLSFRFFTCGLEVYPSNSKVLEHLKKADEGLLCCESSPRKCWRHFLKGAVEKIDENPNVFTSYEVLWA